MMAGTHNNKNKSTKDHEECENHKNCEDYFVTDSVHERFRRTYVRCDDCKQNILGNETAIKKHFNDSHPSDKHCHYCKGKVFIYRKVTTMDDEESSESFVYHKCKHNEPLEENTSDKPIRNTQQIISFLTSINLLLYTIHCVF
ncbi:hypothetical protein P5V15_005180 [Pogonomyrmex californicus]